MSSFPEFANVNKRSLPWPTEKSTVGNASVRR
jgi:hypothetical protein